MSVGWSFCFFRLSFPIQLLNVNDSGCNKEELMKMSRDCMNDHILWLRASSIVAGNILV